jgi:outer membrane protein insertion porin family
MEMVKSVHYILSAILILLLVSCSNTRRLPEGDSLYLGSNVKIKDNEATRRERRVLQTTDLEGAIKPKPNTTILGVRFKLTMYNLGGGDSGKGIRKFFRRLGEPPVLASSFDSAKNVERVRTVLENKGFFYPTASCTLKTRRKKSWGNFDVYTGPQYKIRNVTMVNDSSAIVLDILPLMENTLLKKDAPYNLDLIKGERSRIDKLLKEKGYYYFKPDDLLAQVDTSIGDHKIDIYLRIKEETSEKSKTAFFINQVYIYTNYRMGRGKRRVDSLRIRRKDDTLFYERYYIIGNTKAYKPFLFTQAMQFRPGDNYNRTDHNSSLNRLVNMGTFKFVKNDFEPINHTEFNAFYYLTPYPKKSLRLELGAMTKNDSRAGSQASLSWKHRNLLRGAEQFTVKGYVGFESQSSATTTRPATYQFGFEPSMSVPRFIVPFFDPQSSSIFVPHTVIRAGYDLIMRQDLYMLHSFKGAYGYTWKEDVKTEHQLFPLGITYVRTDTLNKDAALKINYSNLIFNGLIIGPTYQLTYNSRGNDPPHKNDIYFDGLADLSGNIYGLIDGANVKHYYDKPKELFNTPYAQYIKLQLDLRYYRNYSANPNSIWANRIILGLGYPYGNSWQLPNIKQFFSGGNSSLRGFRSRLVGPGTFHEPYNNRTFIETSGDIKLEFNTELRSQLYQFVHGAAFIDVGNVWMRRKDPRFPGGEISNNFLSQLAADVGLGLRLDFKILVIRLDAGVPVLKPWSTAVETVTANRIGLKGENLILNFAIGYPF